MFMTLGFPFSAKDYTKFLLIPKKVVSEISEQGAELLDGDWEEVMSKFAVRENFLAEQPEGLPYCAFGCVPDYPLVWYETTRGTLICRYLPCQKYEIWVPLWRRLGYHYTLCEGHIRGWSRSTIERVAYARWQLITPPFAPVHVHNEDADIQLPDDLEIDPELLCEEV